MKRNLVIAGICLAIALLAVRAVYLTYHRAERDRDWFLAHLGYNFRTQIDSVVAVPNRKNLFFLLFHHTAGTFDPGQERKLNRKMKQRNMTLISPSEGGYEIVVWHAAVLPGDSLFINSALDSLTVRRGKKAIFRARVSGSAHGKPWK